MAEPITVASTQYDEGDAFPNTLGFDGVSPVAPASMELPAASHSNDDAIPNSGDIPSPIQSNSEAEALGMDGVKYPPEGAVMDIDGHYLFVRI